MNPKLRKSLPARVAAWAFIGIILLANVLMLHMFGVSVPLPFLLWCFYGLAAVALVAAIGCIYVLFTLEPDAEGGEEPEGQEEKKEDA